MYQNFVTFFQISHLPAIATSLHLLQSKIQLTNTLTAFTHFMRRQFLKCSINYHHNLSLTRKENKLLSVSKTFQPWHPRSYFKKSPLNTSPLWFCKCLKLWFRRIKMIILNLKWLSTRRLGRLCGNTVWTTTDPWDHRENTRLDRTLYLYPIIMIVRVVVLVLLCFQILEIALIFLFWNDWEILWNHAWELTQSWNGLILKWPPSGRWSIWLN